MSHTAALRRLTRLAQIAVQGTLVEVYVRCGTQGCACHQDPARRHGPHLYLKYRTPEGRSTGMYIPRAHEAAARQAVAAWADLWATVVALGQRNRAGLHQRVRRRTHATPRR